MPKFHKPKRSETCTVLMSGAEAGVRTCGKPAVVILISSLDGAAYAECRDHTTTDALAAVGLSENHRDDLRRGTQVYVDHVGARKVGTVIGVRRTWASVEVPLADGRTKVIQRPIEEIIPVL